MPELRRKVVAVGRHSRGVIIPAPFCEMLGLDVGTPITFKIVGTQIIIKKAEEGVIKKEKKGEQREGGKY